MTVIYNTTYVAWSATSNDYKRSKSMSHSFLANGLNENGNIPLKTIMFVWSQQNDNRQIIQRQVVIPPLAYFEN